MIEGLCGGTDGPTGVLGAEHLTEELCGLRFRISHTAFLQTNTEMAERLYAIAGDFAGARRQRAPLRPLLRHRHDRPLARRATPGEVWGLESVPEAIADAEVNAAANGIENAQFVCADARTRHRAADRAAGRPDIVIVDPPRAGLSQKIVRRAARVRRAADRLRLLQPDDARAERSPDRRGRIYAAPREAGRHVPADAARRSAWRCWRRRERARLRRRRRPRPGCRRAAGSTLRSSSATRRCGRTTTPARSGSRRWRCSPRPRPSSISASR